MLVTSFKRLRRKLPLHVGWARVIETKTSEVNPEAENVPLHFVMLFPPGQSEDVRAIDWNTLWKECAGALARDTDPKADFAGMPDDVINYMTKGFDWDYAQDGCIGAENPRRYMYRVESGHAKFSYGGRLRLKLNIDTSDPTGLSLLMPRSTERRRARRQERRPLPDIPVEEN